MFGDYLKKFLKDGMFLKCENKINSDNAFWKVLKECVIEDIKQYAPHSIDSDTATKIYYKILSQNIDLLPTFVCDICPSNNQERYRVAVRNIFSSNAYNKTGIANNPNIKTERIKNDNNKGETKIYKWKGQPK